MNSTDPRKPTLWEPVDAHAFKALARGEATADQQKHALNFLVNELAGTYDLSYRPERPYDTSFAEGKRHVGLQVVKLLNVDLMRLKQLKDRKGDSSNA